MDKFGLIGQGPEDVISPERILSINNANIYYNDVNTRRLLEIKKRGQEDKFYFEKFMPYPDKIYPSALINYSDSYIVGRKIQIGSTNEFYIYDTKKDSLLEIAIYPTIHDIADPNYYCASHIAMNADKNRIITGKYFMDIINVYDMSGSRLKTMHFSDHPIPSIDQKHKSLDILWGYTGFSNPFCAPEHCFFKRVIEVSSLVGEEKMVSETIETVIIKMDWDGHIIKSYKIEDELMGDFCVDEENNILYGITHSIEDDDIELYHIVSFQID